MSHIAFPRLDETILARRGVDRRAAGGDPAARMPHRRRIRPPRVRDRRAHRLSPPAARGGAAALDRGGRAGPAALPRREGQCRAARRRDLALRRRDPAGGRGRHRADQDEPHSRGQPRRPLRAGRGGRDQSRDLGGSRAEGFFYAPDPSSQLACTIGGNIAMNSGGAHCLKYGVTTNNLLGVRLVTLDGEILDLGGEAMDAPGYDLLGLVCGSEGQLGIVTEAIVRLIPLAGRGAAGSVRLQFGRGREPMRRRDHRRRHRSGRDGVHGQARDPHLREFRPRRLSARRRGDADHRGRGLGRRDRRRCSARIGAIAKAHNVRTVRESMSAMESAQIWKGRKSAFGATGRVADYICMDGTVPTGRLPEALQRTGEICASFGLRVANVFHAGDGNMHPLILYNVNDEDERIKAEAGGRGHSRNVRRSRRLPDRRARRRHREARADGAPVQRRRTRAAEAGARRVRSRRAAQPGQGLSARRAGGMTEALKPEREADVVEAVLAARLEGTKLDIVGGGAMAGLGRPRAAARRLSSAAMSGIVFYAPAEMTLCARAGTTIAAIEATIAEHGQMLPFEPMRPRALWGSGAEPTLGGMVATNLSGPRRPSAGAVRDGVLGLEARQRPWPDDPLRRAGDEERHRPRPHQAQLRRPRHARRAHRGDDQARAAGPRPKRRWSCRSLANAKAVEAMTRALGSPFGVSGAAWLAPGMGRDFSRTLLRLEGFAESVDYRAGRLAALIGEFGQRRQADGRGIRRALALGSRRRIHRRATRSRRLAGEPRALAGGAVRRRPRRDGARPFLRLGRRPRLGRDRGKRRRRRPRFAAPSRRPKATRR